MSQACPHCSAEVPVEDSSARTLTCPVCRKDFDRAKAETLPIGTGPTQGSPGTKDAARREATLPPGTTFGQYRIETLIGRGGMGAVYRALQTSLDRKVALKVLPEDLCKDPQFVERFQRESRAMAELNHPSIVSVYDRGIHDGNYYFVMEYVDGVDLRTLISRKAITDREALRIVPQICEALQYAHDQGVIHRDIKPENILIDRHGRVKVTDFGLARILRGTAVVDSLTRSDVIMGTVNYMAPEQREDPRHVDHRADIYSLGVVFYEMLTGELPLGRFDPPSKRNLQVDVRLDEVVLKVLDKDPARRYQHASEIGTQVERISSSPVPSDAPHTAAEAPPRPAPPPEGELYELNILRALKDGLEVYGTDAMTYAIVALVVWLVSWATLGLLAGPLHAGLLYMALRNLRGDSRVIAADGFAGLHRFWPLFISFWITAIAATIGFVFCLVPGVLILAAWMYSELLIMDRGLGALDSLGVSWRLVSRSGFWRHILLAFLLLCVMGAADMLVAVALPVGFLCLPFVSGVVASAYRQVTGEARSPAPTP